MEASLLAPVQTLPEKIAEVLSTRVIEGRYHPGERLIESGLTREFGVSHGPVRDALRILQNCGLVTIHPYRGAQVTELSVREVTELYQVRAALVGLRARWFAEDPDRAELVEQVGGPIGRLAAIAADDTRADEYLAAAFAVNRMLTECLANRWLRSTLQALTLQTSRYTRLALATPERRRESARLWATLLDAIRTGDGDRAQQLAADISLTTRDAAIRRLEQEAAAPPAKGAPAPALR